MSTDDADRELDQAVAAAKVAAGLDPNEKCLPHLFDEHLEHRLRAAFWHRHTRQTLDHMLRETKAAR